MMKIRNHNHESADTCMIALSTSFCLMGSNPVAKKLLGIASQPGEIYPLEKIFDQDSLGAADKLFKDVINRRMAMHSIKAGMVHSDGRRILCSVSALPLVSTGLETIGIILYFRAMAKKMVQESKPPSLKYLPRMGYQGVVDGLPEGVFTIDRSWRINSFNKTAEMLTGYANQDIIGKLCWQVFQCGSCRSDCPFAKVFQSGRPCENQEVTIVTRTGFARKIITNVGPLKAADGTVVGAIKTFRPKPAQKKMPGRPSDVPTFQGMIGSSRAMKSMFAMLKDIALSETGVLLTGESGTGKELVARAIHNLSHQHQGSFVAVNCSALPETLLESELFGHEQGAFTGADHLKPGRFERADNGTLFLDEIGELKPSLQVKLLRVLERKEFERVGGSAPLRLNARIIAATNKDLGKALDQGTFRQDLYYRLRTIPIHIPPLRERTQDIPLLVEHFIKKFNLKYDKNVRLADPKVMGFFMQYPWPGNIRELERCMEHAFVFVKGPIIFPKYLPQMGEFNAPSRTVSLPEDTIDQDDLLWALDQTKGKRAEAAELLSISRTSLWRKMKKAGLL